jgi:hypothetical protein
MDNEQIKSTIDYFKGEGVEIRVRDIAYTLLSRMFADRKTAYQCLFGTDGYDEYVNDEKREQLDAYLTQVGFIRSVSTDEDTGEISFEENKSALTKMIADIEIDMSKGLIEKKDGYARIADIRYKLNDKFKVEAAQKDRMIIVEKKFDFVCPHTRHECYQLDKETAMKKWNLIENPNSNEND